MATSPHQDETYTKISDNVLHVYKGQRAINTLIRKLCNTMRNPNMHDKLSGHMQGLLYDLTLMKEEEGVERSPCGTPNLPPSCHEEEDEGLIKTHEDTPQQ